MTNHANLERHKECPLRTFLDEESNMSLFDFFEAYKNVPILESHTNTEYHSKNSLFSPLLHFHTTSEMNSISVRMNRAHSTAKNQILHQIQSDFAIIMDNPQTNFRLNILNPNLHEPHLSVLDFENKPLQHPETNIKTIKCVWKQFYAEYRYMIPRKIISLCDFLFQLFFFEKNLSILLTTGPFVTGTSECTYLQELFSIFKHILCSKYLKSGAMDIFDNILQYFFTKLSQFILNHADILIDYDRCIGFRRSMYPKDLFSGQIIRLPVQYHANWSLRVTDNGILPLFNVENSGIISLVDIHRGNTELMNLNSWIFIKKKNVSWDSTIPLVFDVFDKRFNLVGIQLIDESDSILLTMDEVRDHALRNWSEADEMAKKVPTNNIINAMIRAFSKIMVIIFYDCE